MTTQVQVAPLEKQAARLPTRQIIAMGIWAGAVWTTAEAVVIIAPSLRGVMLYLFATIIQIIMTYLESDIWSGKFRLLPVLVLLLDVVVNAGGLWFWLFHIDQMPAWDMMVEAFGAPFELSIRTKAIISLGCGALLAYAPEAIWNGERK